MKKKRKKETKRPPPNRKEPFIEIRDELNTVKPLFTGSVYQLTPQHIKPVGKRSRG